MLSRLINRFLGADRLIDAPSGEWSACVYMCALEATGDQRWSDELSHRRRGKFSSPPDAVEAALSKRGAPARLAH